MSTDIKINKLIRQLTRSTAEGVLRWKPAAVPRSLTEATDDRYHSFFVTNFKHRKIAIAERKFQDFNVEFEQLFWNAQIALMFLDLRRNDVIWTHSEQTEALKNLFDLAAHGASNIDELLDNLLADDE